MTEGRAPITCTAFRAGHARYARLPLPRAVWDTPEYGAWAEHRAGCAPCGTWSRTEHLIARGVDPGAHPCLDLAEQVTHRCDEHRDPQDCPDVLVRYLPERGAYGLPIRDGGTAVSLIRYCPWCGVALPEGRPPGQRP